MAQTITPADAPPAPAAKAIPAVLSAAARWSILFLLAIGVLIAFVDRTSISVAMADLPFKTHFHLTDTDRGMIGAMFFWSYGLVQIPMGWLVDRYGVKTPYTICFALWCVATAGNRTGPAR
jgi:ACS family D-galactonate transporter-like MFS transporter